MCRGRAQEVVRLVIHNHLLPGIVEPDPDPRLETVCRHVEPSLAVRPPGLFMLNSDRRSAPSPYQFRANNGQRGSRNLVTL